MVTPILLIASYRLFWSEIQRMCLRNQIHTPGNTDRWRNYSRSWFFPSRRNRDENSSSNSGCKRHFLNICKSLWATYSQYFVYSYSSIKRLMAINYCKVSHFIISQRGYFQTFLLVYWVFLYMVSCLVLGRKYLYCVIVKHNCIV